MPTILTPDQMAALAALQAVHNAGQYTLGNPPAVVDGSTVRGFVIVAAVDYNERPALTVYRWRDLLHWHQRAVRYLAADGTGERSESSSLDLVAAMQETKPEGIEQ